jgi:hypothetical protein
MSWPRDRSWLRLTVVPALLLALAIGVAPSSAQPAVARAPRVPRILARTFRCPHDDAHARAIVQRAIEPRRQAWCETKSVSARRACNRLPKVWMCTSGNPARGENPKTSESIQRQARRREEDTSVVEHRERVRVAARIEHGENAIGVPHRHLARRRAGAAGSLRRGRALLRGTQGYAASSARGSRGSCAPSRRRPSARSSTPATRCPRCQPR